VPLGDDISAVGKALGVADRQGREHKREVSRLEGIIEQLERQLHDARQTKFTLPTGRPPGGSKRKSFCRVCVPDTHGCYIDSSACKAFLADLEQIDPSEVVLLGDHIDCGGFLAQHQTLGYVAEGEYAFADDVAAANQFLDAIQQRAPRATIYYLEGNHERRIERWIITQTLRNGVDAKYLHSMFSTSAVLSLAKRKIRLYPQGQTVDGRDVPSILKLGKCNFMHGIYTTKNAAKSHVDEFVCNIVFAHTHRRDSYTRRTVDDTYSAYNDGCLCLKQQYYNHSRITHHTHGYGVQGVQADGGFLHISVPIIDGRSYLKPLAAQLGG
jgi:hypothetical protein